MDLETIVCFMTDRLCAVTDRGSSQATPEEWELAQPATTYRRHPSF